MQKKVHFRPIPILFVNLISSKNYLFTLTLIFIEIKMSEEYLLLALACIMGISTIFLDKMASIVVAICLTLIAIYFAFCRPLPKYLQGIPMAVALYSVINILD